MPRYTQVTPTFTPVDYATRIAPLEQYKDEYDKRLDKIEEQGLLADAIGGLIDENTDPELMQVYNDYSTKMQNTAKDLLDSGDLRSSRQSLLELRRDYANKLLPIQQAFNNRADAAKSYREQKAKDPTYIGTDPLLYGLKDYMNGKMPNDKTASGAALYALGQADAKAASGREIRDTAWRLDKNLGNQFFTKIQKEGWNQDEVMTALANLANDDNKDISDDAKNLIGYINNAVARIHKDNGIDEFKDTNKIAQADGWILSGIISGIGYKQDDKQQKYDATMWLDKQIKEEQLKKLRGQSDTQEPKDNLSYGITPHVVVNGKVRDYSSMKQMLSDIRAKKVSIDSPVSDPKLYYRDTKLSPRSVTTGSWQISGTLDSQETYGRSLYELAKSQKLINKDMSYENFRKQFDNMSDTQIDSLISNISDKILRNAERYGEFHSNLVDTEYLAKAINDANGSRLDAKGNPTNKSLITDAKGNPVGRIPDDLTAYLPLDKDRRSIANNRFEFRDKSGKSYYVDPSVFYGAQVVSPMIDERTGEEFAIPLSLNDAIKTYYNAIDNGDDEYARYLGEEIFDQLAVYIMNRVKKQSSTDSKI